MNLDGSLGYRFYEKEMAFQFTLMSNTAISDQTKTATGTSEVLRRLMNTRYDEPQAIKDEILETYILNLQRSQYSQQKISKILVTGITVFERRIEICKKTGRDIHRDGKTTKSWRIKRKLLAKSNWMKPGWRNRRLRNQNPVILEAEEEARE